MTTKTSPRGAENQHTFIIIYIRHLKVCGVSRALFCHIRDKIIGCLQENTALQTRDSHIFYINLLRNLA